MVSLARSKYFVSDPVTLHVQHDDIKRKVNAHVFLLKCISVAKRYMETVQSALMFDDFCPDRGCYITRDGNTPALRSRVMFGRLYFIPRTKLNGPIPVSGLVYDHEKSEAEAKLFDSKHEHHFYKAACLDIETVFDKLYQDESLRCQSFAYKFPYYTEGLIADMTKYQTKLVGVLSSGRKQLPKHVKCLSIPSLAPDMSGEQHEITCVSIVILNYHIPKTTAEYHRKRLMVLYNKCKVKDSMHPRQITD